MYMRTFFTLGFILALLGIAGCGGSGSGGGGGDVADTEGVFGRITGFGSVFVDGVKYNTDSADIVIDGVPATQDELGVGMLVWLRTESDHARALSIDYRDELEGVVQAVNIAADGTGMLTVMRQTVIVDELTVFDSDVVGITSLDALPVGSVVEVSGHTSGSDGEILATRVELKHEVFLAGVHEIEIKGVVAGHDDTAMTFLIGALTVDYSAAEFDDIPNGMLGNGMFVEVKSERGFDGNGNLLADKVELERRRYEDFDDVGRFKIEGRITAVTVDSETAAVTAIEVNGYTLWLTKNTRFKHGSVTNLMIGAEVKVRVLVDGDRYVAQEVKFKEAHADIRIKANVEAVAIDERGEGTITLLGQTVHVNAFTMMQHDHDDESDSDHAGKYFHIDNLATRDRVDVRAFQDNSGALVAVRLKRIGPSDRVRLKGPVIVNGTDTTVVGVAVDLDSNFPDFTPVAGMQLDMDGVWDGARLTAGELEVEDRGEVSAVTRNLGAVVDFTLNTFTYQVNDSTEYEDGDETRLVIGALVEVEAEVQVPGASVIAEEVEFEENDSEIEVKACLEAIDAGDGITGSITLLEQIIQVSAFTERDGFDLLSELQAGDCVKVKLYVNSASALVAVKVKREDDALKKAEVEGPIAVDGDGNVSVGPFGLDLSNFPGFMAPAGQRLEFKGFESGGQLVVTEIEFEHE